MVKKMKSKVIKSSVRKPPIPYTRMTPTKHEKEDKLRKKYKDETRETVD